ncbi:MAG: hypothetical protein R6V29_03085 [Spirochaetia bacterium]
MNTRLPAIITVFALLLYLFPILSLPAQDEAPETPPEDNQPEEEFPEDEAPDDESPEDELPDGDEPDEELPEGEPVEDYAPTYSLGDQTLAINMGLFIPLFYSGGPDGTANANLSLGGTGSLQWNSYLNNNMTLGGELSGMFAFTPNERALFMVPLTVRYSYIFRAYPFEFPLHIGAGVNFSRLEEQGKIDPIVKPGASVLWNMNPDWAFGLNLTYWWVPQWYTGDLSDDTRYGNFLETTLSAVYHF